MDAAGAWGIPGDASPRLTDGVVSGLFEGLGRLSGVISLSAIPDAIDGEWFSDATEGTTTRCFHAGSESSSY